MGVRPLFDDLCRRLATHGFAVCAPEPFARAPVEVRGRRDEARMGVREGARRRPADRRPRGRGRLPRRARRRARGRACSASAWAAYSAQGGGDRPLRPRGRVLRDDPRARRLGRPGARVEPLDTAADVCPTLAIFGADDPCTPAADIEALRAAWADRPDCEIVVYDERRPRFVHDPERPAHRADDAADAWRRVARASCCPTDRDRAAERHGRSAGWPRSCSASRSRMR